MHRMVMCVCCGWGARVRTMGGKGSRPPRHLLLRVALVGGIALAGGCLPQSGNDGESGKQSAMSFAGTGGVPSTKTDKADALGQVASAARNLFGDTEAQPAARRDRVQTAARDDRAIAAAGPSLAPLPLPEIDDTSASVALASFF